MARSRSLWSGSLSFGLVNVPVALVSGVRDQDLHFHQIHRKTHERLHVAYVCTKEQRPVDYSEIAHGYDAGDGYVMLTDDELAAAEPEKTRTIEIAEFVERSEIDPIYYDHPYYLLPAGEGEGPLRAYRLLVEVMADADKVAIGQFVLRTREYLVAVRPKDGLLGLTTMLFHDEIRPTDELDLPTRKRPGKAKVDQAVALVAALGEDFDHRRYRDRYRERLRKLVKDKEAGETIKAPPAPASPEAPPDLMVALKESLDRVRAGS
ncbi:MAG: end-binding protein Ku [Solirubrobacteraceae bacterium]|jgi:DNA end-binding protein Ku|nr:end-binding protein Ku [Solirubrobacteraceae bacterium]